MKQEEEIIARIIKLGFPIKMGDPIRPTMLDLADKLTREATKGRGTSKSLLTALGLMAFAISSLSPEVTTVEPEVKH